MKVCMRILLALVLVVFLVGVVEADSYKILHKEGAVYDSEDGWLMTSPPYYVGSEWVVDFAVTPDGLMILHRDGGYWDETAGWVLSSPPYYAGSDYARALESDNIMLEGTGFPQLQIMPGDLLTAVIAYGIKFGTDVFSIGSFITLPGWFDDYNDTPVFIHDPINQEFSIEMDTTVNADFTVTGEKNFVMPDPTDPTKEIYYACLEGPESGTYVRGTAEVVDGTAVITLPDHFAKVTAEEGLTVTLTPYGAPLQLYVVEKGTSQIVVGEASGQSGSFDYLVQGVRRGYEDYQVVRDVTIDRNGRREAVRDAFMNQK